MFSAGGVLIATFVVTSVPPRERAGTDQCYLRDSVAASMRGLQLPHRLFHGLVHAQRVRALRRREVLQALQVRSEEWTSRRRRPQLRGEELAPDVAPLVRFGIHLFHRIHEQIE